MYSKKLDPFKEKLIRENWNKKIEEVVIIESGSKGNFKGFR